MREPAATAGQVEVDIGVVRGVADRVARADFQNHRLARAAILQMVRVSHAGLKAGAVTTVQHLFAGVGDEYHFALEHVDEFVLGFVPVALAGPTARGQAQQVHAELAQAGGIAQTPALARAAGLVVRRRITRAEAGGAWAGSILGTVLLCGDAACVTTDVTPRVVQPNSRLANSATCLPWYSATASSLLLGTRLPSPLLSVLAP